MNKKIATFYVARHGETKWNEKGILQGQLDSPLNVTGLQQAQELANSFKDIKFSAVYSSDLGRTMATAKPVSDQHKCQLITDKRLRERNFGSFQGKPVKDFREFFKDKINQRNQLNKHERMKFKLADDVESDQEIVDRFLSLLKETTPKHLGETILIVTHGGIIRKFLVWVGFGQHDELPRGSVTNHAYFVLETNGSQFDVVYTHDITKLPPGSYSQAG